MAIKFEKIEAGMVLLDCHRTRMGQSAMSRWGLWTVKILSVNREKRSAMVSWNGNPPERWFAYRLQKLHREPPKAYRDQEARGRW